MEELVRHRVAADGFLQAELAENHPALAQLGGAEGAGPGEVHGFDEDGGVHEDAPGRRHLLVQVAVGDAGDDLPELAAQKAAGAQRGKERVFVRVVGGGNPAAPGANGVERLGGNLIKLRGHFHRPGVAPEGLDEKQRAALLLHLGPGCHDAGLGVVV